VAHILWRSVLASDKNVVNQMVDVATQTINLPYDARLLIVANIAVGYSGGSSVAQYGIDIRNSTTAYTTATAYSTTPAGKIVTYHGSALGNHGANCISYVPVHHSMNITKGTDYNMKVSLRGTAELTAFGGADPDPYSTVEWWVFPT
jgi:surface antigen